MTIDAPLRNPRQDAAPVVAKAPKTKARPAARDLSHIARPLIVCGMGRSGTRMCANILGNSSLVELQGEIGGPVGTKLVAWLEAVRSQKRADGHQCLYRLARAAFRDSSPGRPLDRPAARWFGHKTPRHERHFDRYERIFDQADRQAMYVYCLRNPFHVWRSYRAMPWNKFKDVDSFLAAWVKSVQIFERMRTEAPGRVLLFNLDDMLRAPDRLEWLRPTLLDPLAISPTTFRRPVETLENSNSAARKVGAPPAELPPADQARIASDPEAARIVRAYFPWMEAELARRASAAPRPSFLRRWLRRLR